MSYVERRRFLWILFLGGIALLAVAAAASATTLSRLKLEDMAQESTAIARMRCLEATSQWEQGEIWTETRFEVLEREKGALPEVVTVRLLGGSVGHLHSHVDEVVCFAQAKKSISSCGRVKENHIKSWAGRKELFALRATRDPDWKWSRRIPRLLRFSIRRLARLGAAAFAIYG